MSMVDDFDHKSLWPFPFGLNETPSATMPWLPPGPVAQQALAVLGHPLHACATGFYFDAEDCYADWAEERKLTRVEKAIRDLGDRLEWRFERVWSLDAESSDEEIAAYEKGTKTVANCRINPRCLDDYVLRANQLMESIGMDEDNPDWELGSDSESVAVHREALEWAEAGVVVLQQSLPWPFFGVIPYSINDNRPVHRALFAYASILAAKHPRKAKPWFRAMLFMNPNDNLGVRYFL